jgi:arginine metabolism regulation protein II
MWLTITLQMIKGDPDNRRTWLVETEKFIRFKGLSQPTLSAKKRALHHCYAYMRIMAETTCIAGCLDRNLVGASCTPLDNTTSIYSTEFRIYPNQAFSVTTMLMEKDPEMAQRDLHLAIPGRWSSTLFPSVYGVDEIFLMLLSQVIRLANEKDLSLMSTETGGAHISLKEFWSRAKALEGAIDHFLCPSTTSYIQRSHDILLTGMAPTAQAMYTALVIFFHRRIYEIDPTMLQGKVNELRVCLINVQNEEGYQNDSDSAGLIWSAFVAACEAVTPELQIFFASWFERCVRSTALAHASVAKKIFENVWEKRNNPVLHEDSCSWPDLLRNGAIKFTCV